MNSQLPDSEKLTIRTAVSQLMQTREECAKYLSISKPTLIKLLKTGEVSDIVYLGIKAKLDSQNIKTE